MIPIALNQIENTKRMPETQNTSFSDSISASVFLIIIQPNIIWVAIWTSRIPIEVARLSLCSAFSETVASSPLYALLCRTTTITWTQGRKVNITTGAATTLDMLTIKA